MFLERGDFGQFHLLLYEQGMAHSRCQTFVEQVNELSTYYMHSALPAFSHLIFPTGL